MLDYLERMWRLGVLLHRAFARDLVAFVCNIGDYLMRWSKDIYVSTPHKVVSPPGGDRYSVAFFLDPDPDAIVACLPNCTGAGSSGQISACHGV